MATDLPASDDIKVAVIVGGHGYDVPGFKALFDGLQGVDWYLQDIDNWVGSPIADQYHVFVFYHMVAWGIATLRKDMDERINAAIDQIGTTDQGWFVWHHALLSFPDSPAYDRVCNSTDRTLKREGRFEPRIDMNVHVEHPRASRHPSTALKYRGQLRHLRRGLPAAPLRRRQHGPADPRPPPQSTCPTPCANRAGVHSRKRRWSTTQ